MKLTKKQIEIIRENTPEELKGSQNFSHIADFGYYQPYNANWSYHAVYVLYKGVKILVVVRFGEIL